jgi:hypothetical protein
MMNDLVYYSPQHEGIILNEEGKLQSLTHSTSFRRESSSNSLSKQHQSSSSSTLTYNSTMSSMASDVSSCARLSSPPGSFHNGLRRSTFDLSDYSASTGTYKSSSSSLRYRGGSQQREGEATKALSELASSSKGSFASFTSSSSYPETETAYSAQAAADATQQKQSNDLLRFMGLEMIIEDVMLGYMALLMLGVNMHRQVTSLLRNLKSFLGTTFQFISDLYHFEEPIERPATRTSSNLLQEQPYFTSLNDTRDMHESRSEEDLLTPFKLVTPPSSATQSEARDEWGHFADFQEELADEKSFIPSCSRLSSSPSRRGTLKKASNTGLATLAEVREDDFEERDDEEEEEDWSF